MTVTQLQTRTFERLGEPSGAPVFYSAAEALEALNIAQRLFVLLSLCLETQASLFLPANTNEVRLLALFSDFILPLRIRDGNGLKVQPGSAEMFAAANDQWRSERSDQPGYYAVHGFDFALFYPAVASVANLTLTYARGPVALTAGGDVPEIPEEYHPALAEAAIVILRLKEGGQELKKELPRWGVFMTAAQECADYVRRRNRAAGYDKMPLERVDLSRALKA